MTIGERNKAVYEYIQTYPQLHSWLYFNTILDAPENASMLTGDDVVVEEYIDGSKMKNYIFEVAFLKEYDTGTSDVNADAIEEAGNFCSWVDEQNELGVFPIFDIDEEIQSISINNTLPNMTVNQDTGTARYTLTCVIAYLTRR